ncbi:TIGR01841 family phasin [Variovorax saccharolyticus]|uniref:TIGR01841 family phasin n=1 Tax=Variovorax saccharolyticus TaxID=3053516 RepID=UPI002576335B|nr:MULTISPECIES: TIGR01841 family phasin [unclassified Variovorax]MDM0022478.1 TIGR01841 family phasin [Variovorax sp. J22R187]MDM0028242.1 TIGR01841 family phasin [Variovorax sp. J31P216]
MTSLAVDTTASMHTIFSLAGEAFKGAETLSSLNLQTLKTLMSESEEGSRLAGSTGSPLELMRLQAAMLQAAPIKALAYGRQVQEVFATFDTARRAAYEDSVASAQAKLLAAMSSFFGNTPSSDKIVSLTQSALDTSNKAYKRMNDATKQLSETVAANVTKASETAAQASSSALAKIET